MPWWKKRIKTALAFGATTHVGRVRAENQDAYGCFPQPEPRAAEEQLFMVADGMGGHAGGKEASQIALTSVPELFFQSEELPVMERLKLAFSVANERIYFKASEENSLAKMGTTCTAMVISNGSIFIAHVGDTRAYRISNGEIVQLTHDHTLVEEMRREGVLTDEEAKIHPRRNTLTRAMGVDSDLDIDVFEAGSIEGNEHFLLCSDGLSLVHDEELQATVLQHAPQNATEQLVDLANERGGFDNITVLVVHIE